MYWVRRLASWSSIYLLYVRVFDIYVRILHDVWDDEMDVLNGRTHTDRNEMDDNRHTSSDNDWF